MLGSIKEALHNDNITLGAEISFTPLENSYILYQLIPNGEAKVQLIENYLRLNGIGNKQLLERVLTGNLLHKFKYRIESLIS